MVEEPVQNFHRFGAQSIKTYINMQVNISFAGNSMTLELPNGSNLGCLRNNRNIAAALGYSSDNVQYIVNGSSASDDVTLSDGDIVSVQHRAHEKAVS